MMHGMLTIQTGHNTLGVDRSELLCIAMYTAKYKYTASNDGWGLMLALHGFMACSQEHGAT